MIGGKKQKHRPLRLKKDKRGRRYIQHEMRGNNNSLKKAALSWSNSNEVAMIKSIQDANFRESVLKNQQELDKETKKKIIDLTNDQQVKQEIPIIKKENDRFDQLEKRLSMLFEAKEEKLKRRQEKDDRSMEILYNQKLTEKRIQELEGKIYWKNLTATNDLVKEYLNSTMSSTKLSTNLGNELKDMVKNQRISVIDLIVSFSQDLKRKQKIGSGRSNQGLYDSEIERIMKPYHRKGFERVIASDQLNLLEPKSKMSFIMNLDPHNKPGSHWVAVYIDADKDKSVEYYDSFGLEPTDDFMKQLKDLIDEIDPDYLFKPNTLIKIILYTYSK
ncbi:hypothetical protein DFA_03727 [Cavenderia fasciculata]|uniref:Ubiquitin-like protease family profile domain-containing protein n=1 Tax=Cavenderia fasciculata TaxID=261658 RepID=F4Q089_CACFS|nr:uncharacterized protein DFA_03727 [Cavenderia fasciculata]EGG18240.1 hypothetical protein DFA_03727 [Cavenderia fasciculata]|eukprot:XP_004357063.1 hypothetical protein DFA_03727 [Cavenderia fasciculata]